MLKDESEKTLEKLGFCINEDRSISRIKKTAVDSLVNYIYCGFNTYLKKGHLFEKVGNELLPMDYEEVDAEIRFVERHLPQMRV